MMKIIVVTESGDILELGVSYDETVENLKALLEVETGVKQQLQKLLINGTEMRNGNRLSFFGVCDGDVIAMNPDSASPSPSASAPPSQSPSPSPSPSASAPPSQSPSPSPSPALRQEPHQGSQSHGQVNQPSFQCPSYWDNSIKDNMQAAMKCMPEGFTSVTMLYVEIKINDVSVKALVDTGAQFSIISKDCAQRCRIYSLMDRELSKTVEGVGTAELLGKIHYAPLEIGSVVGACNLYVMDTPNMDLIFGLNMLLSLKCIIDGKDKAIKLLDGSAVPFLDGSDIPIEFFGGGQK